MKNKNFADKVGNIISISYSAESAKAITSVMDKILATPKSMSNKNFADNVGNMLKFIDSKAKAGLFLNSLDNLDKAYPNLTHLLKNELHSGESLDLKLLTHLSTDRNVGGIPDGWLNNTSKSQQKEVVTKLYDRLADFGKTKNATDDQIKSLSGDLGTLLNSDVNIKFVGNGTFGNGYKVTIGEKDFFLKTFKDEGSTEHGSRVEVQAGLYANNHARENQFTKFFFGRVTGSIYEDGFMVNEFIEVNTKKATPAKKNNPIIDSRPLYQDFVTSNDKGASTNGSSGHNTINGKIIDFGAFFKENPHLDNPKMRQTFRVFAERIYENKSQDGSTDYVMSDANAKILLNYAKKNLSEAEFEQAVQTYSQKLSQNSGALKKLFQIQDEIYKLR